MQLVFLSAYFDFGMQVWVYESYIYVSADVLFLYFYVICLSFSDSPLPVSSRVCFVKFHDPDSAVVAQHLTNTVFVDRALIVVPYAEGLCFVYLSMWASNDDHLPQYSFRVSISSMLKI